MTRTTWRKAMSMLGVQLIRSEMHDVEPLAGYKALDPRFGFFQMNCQRSFPDFLGIVQLHHRIE